MVSKQFLIEMQIQDMAASEELLFLDLRLTDASALCFRGVWVTAKHRAQLKLPLSSRLKVASVPLMQKYGCLSQTQNLNLIVPVSRDVDPAFLSCMRMASADPEMLQRLETRGWFDRWPRTLPIDQRNEQSAAQLAVELLQKVLERLTQSNSELRQRFGSASVVQRPCVRVREAETMVVVSLLKSMQELALLSRWQVSEMVPAATNTYSKHCEMRSGNPCKKPSGRCAAALGKCAQNANKINPCG
eukprot:s46_g51.t1